MINKKLTEKEAERLLENMPEGMVWVSAVVYIGLIAIVVLACLCSCSTSKSMDSYVEHHRDSVRVTTLSDEYKSSSRQDSIVMGQVKVDSVAVRLTVVDSVVVEKNTETVITNTVDSAGNLLCIDKVTTQYVNRDHWRVEKSDVQSLHNGESLLVAKSQTADTVKILTAKDSIVYNGDSIVSERQTVIEKKQSWWSKFQERVGRIVLCIIAIVALALIGRLGYKYYVGK